MIVTRFNPTTNGGLHLGHIYSLLINEHYAHDNNGKFYVRFDDTSAAIHAEMAHPEIAKEILKRQREDIEWLGVKVDGWIIQSEILEEVHEKMQPRYAILQDKRPHYLPVSIRLGNSWTPYPYVPFETAERVIMDQMIGATHLIRGEEFLTEYSMYRYFCEIFNFDYPKFIFLPRLQGKCGDISKTNGGYKISELRGNGYSASDVKDMLAWACLNWWNNGWSLFNLKSNPKIDL